MAVEMRIKRAKLAEQANAILTRATAEARDLTAEEAATFDRLHTEIEAMRLTIDRTERQELLGIELRTSLGTIAGGKQTATLSTEGYDTAELLTGEKSFVEHVRARGNYESSCGAGAYLRAMVAGPRNDAEARALAGGTDSAGGFTVPQVLGAEIIDRLRAATVCGRAGARWVPLVSGTTRFAQVISDPVAGWRAENAAVPESSLTFGAVTFVPRTLAVIVRASRELLEDSLNAERALLTALSGSLAVELDRVALRGAGTGAEPRGIANTAGVGSFSMGVNGAALTNHDPFLQARNLVLTANGAEPSAYVMAPRTATAAAMLKDTTGQPMARPEALANARFLPTTSLPINETQGTSTDASRIILGDWRDLWIGVRTEIRIEVLKERYADTLQFGFLCYLRADIGIVRPASFAQIVGIR